MKICKICNKQTPPIPYIHFTLSFLSPTHTHPPTYTAHVLWDTDNWLTPSHPSQTTHTLPHTYVQDSSSFQHKKERKFTNEIMSRGSVVGHDRGWGMGWGGKWPILHRVIVCSVNVWPRGESCLLVWRCVLSLTYSACHREAQKM